MAYWSARKFRSFHSTADLLPVLSDRAASAFNRCRITKAVALNILKVWHPRFLWKLKTYRLSGQVFSLASSFCSDRQLQVILYKMSSQEYPVNAGIPQVSILGPTIFLPCINDLPDDSICNNAIYPDNITLYVMRHLFHSNK